MGYPVNLPVPWTRQPSIAVGINGTSPYAKNLITALPLQPNWGMRNLVSGVGVTRTGLAERVVYADNSGPLVYPSFGTSNYLSFDAPPQITSGTQPVTFAWNSYAVATSAYSTVLMLKVSGMTNGFVIFRSSADPNYYMSAGRRNGGNAPKWDLIVTNGVAENFVLVCAGGLESNTAADYQLYRNGVLQSQSGTTVYSISTATASHVGALEDGTNPWEGAIGDLFIWNGALPVAMAAQFYSQRWGIYPPLARRIWSGAAAAPGGFVPAWVRRGSQIIGAGVH